MAHFRDSFDWLLDRNRGGFSYALEMPTHLLRALYVRDRRGLTVTDPPRAFGVGTVTGDPRPDLTDDWVRWWAWLIRLDVTDDRLRDRPDQLAQESQCPPAIHALLAENAKEVSSWTTNWRTRFREEIAPGSTDVELKLARHLARTGVRDPLVVRILPLDGDWLTWVTPTMFLVSQRLREDPGRYTDHATTGLEDQASS